MIVHRGAWVLPVAAPPIRNGWVAVEGGRIVALGGPADRAPQGKESFSEPFSEPFVILPGLVNAHVHLELSWMRGAVPPASSMPAWAAQLLSLRRANVGEPADAMRVAIDDARSFGTSLVGDVANTLESYHALADSPMWASVFFEQIGFRVPDPASHAAAAQSRMDALPQRTRMRAWVAPHAPYSVSPGLLTAIGALGSRVVSIHLAESAEELQFLRDGTGAWRTLLEALGVWDATWRAPDCGPVEYIARAGLLNERLVAVHGVQLADAELSRLASADATLVTCPRSNVWTGAGAPPIERFYASGVRVAVGTDSLASVDDLNLFSELAAIRAAAPGIPAAKLLASATAHGADALGFGAELGTIEPGKHAELIAVRIPEAVGDVEEYLVHGVQPGDIRWLNG